MSSNPAIEIDDLEVKFPSGQSALTNFNLTIDAGKITSIVGPSGCGKSTLLRCVGALTHPSTGTVRLYQQKRIAFVFQHSNLLPWRTVADNIGLPLELNRCDGEQKKAKIEAALRLIDLHEDDAVKFPRMLSGGMQMRVSLARALVTNPDLLLLDEPFAALDDMLRQELNEQLLRIWQKKKCTILFVTHNVHEAIFLGHRVIVLSKGPGTICATVDIPFDYPRNHDLKTSAEFAMLYGDVSAKLRKAAQ